MLIKIPVKKKKERKKKTTYGMGENSFKQCNWQGLNLQNIQTTYTAQQQENQQPNLKMGRRPK